MLITWYKTLATFCTPAHKYRSKSTESLHLHVSALNMNIHQNWMSAAFQIFYKSVHRKITKGEI